MRKALILDLDNTLYSWMDAFSDSFRVQVEFLCQSLCVKENIIINDFKSVFRKYNSVEVPNAVYQLSVWNNCGVPKCDIQKIQETSLCVFLEGWRNNIKLFPKVEETLDWAQKSNFLIFAYSDAFAFWVDFRLSTLKIQSYFDDIFALTDKAISDSNLVVDFERHCQITSFEESEMKPNISILCKILDKYNIAKEHAYFIGDSLAKDIETAKRIGICDVWSKYGLKYRRENARLLSHITPWEKAQGQVDKIHIKPTPTYAIKSFDEIKNIITHREEELCLKD